MKHAPIDELKQSLITYEAVAKTSNVDSETKDGIEMIANTVKRLVAALENDDADKAFLETLTFSRQASDVYFEQPESFKRLASVIGGIRRVLQEHKKGTA